MEIDFNKYPLPKRLRHHTTPNLYFKLSELKEKPGFYPPAVEEMDWEEVFINGKQPDMLDVGCGKGVFLLNMSEKYPDKNILGIELRKAAVEWINGVVRGEGIPNGAAIWYSVVNGLHFIEDKSIEKVFYLFPDPWPKRKHLKRRAFNEEFLSDIYRVLKDDGHFYLATDVPEVDSYHKKVLDVFGKFDYGIVQSDNQWLFPVTNKEKFCRKENISFFRLICSKK
ncbi:tRNA (guanosine(46)-N7)-methyltransferase TrmB [Bacteroidota bacterium]